MRTQKLVVLLLVFFASMLVANAVDARPVGSFPVGTEPGTQQINTPGTGATATVATQDCWSFTPDEFFATATAATVRACLAAGADVGELDAAGNAPLHWATRVSTNPAVVAALLAAGANLEARAPARGLHERSRPGGATPLHEAVRENALASIIEMLLEAGADPNTRDDEDRTPLHEASTPEQYTMLLAAGADPNARMVQDHTPLHTASGGPVGFKMLLAAGADVDARNEFGKTPLDYAVRFSESAEVVDLLVAAGAEVNTKDLEGNTPLHSAALEQENPAVFEALFGAGADLNARDAAGETPLFVAAGNNANPEVIAILLARTSDLRVRDDYGRTLLHAAADNEQPAVLEMLLATGLDVNARTAEGVTALHLAALGSGWQETERLLPTWLSYTSPAVVEVLLAAGARVEARDIVGGTPLHWAAAESRNPAVIEALLAAGADANARDEAGRTASDWRSESYRLRLLQLGEISELLRPNPSSASPPAANLGEADTFRDCPTCPQMVELAGGVCRGCSTTVEVAPFALSKYEVTRGQFAVFVEATGHDVHDGCIGGRIGSWRDQSWQSDDHPVVCVGWDDAQAYAQWLSAETGQAYRLPSESEWVYAAHAGTTTSWFWGTEEAERCGYANGGGDDDCEDGWERTAPVGSFGANGFGLHDLAGNVWEWVADCWHGDYGSTRTQRVDCRHRVLRGGSWLSVPWLLTSGHRSGSDSQYRSVNRGFRVAR